MRPALLAGAAGGALAVMLVVFALPSDLFGRVPPLTGTLSAQPQHVAVVDGETLLLRETVIRLLGVAAPGRGQACRANPATDCGAAAADALAALVRGQAVECRLNGRDQEGFALGLCEAAGVELNRAVVAAGWARARRESPDFSAEEADARAAKRGLWAGGM